MNSVTKLDALTTLRFFAAAMIVIGHVHPLFGSLGVAKNFALAQGVSFFFVLSGFILAYNYKTLQDGKSVKRFLVARFARIWPLHIATLSIWIYLFYPNFINDLISSTQAAFKLFLHIMLLQSWSFTEPWIVSFNGAAWSISTEAFFYVVFAFIFINPKNRFPIILTLSIISLITLIFIATRYSLSTAPGTTGFTVFSVLYTNPIMRVFEFLFGVCCAKLFFKYKDYFGNVKSKTWLFIEITSISIAIYSLYLAARPSLIAETLGNGASYYFHTSGIWYSWGGLILTFALSNGPISKLLSLRPLVFLGEISFALYLVHPSIYAQANYYGIYVKGIENIGVTDVMLFWLVCILSASLLHIIIEKPCRKLIMNWWDGKSPYKLSYKTLIDNKQP
ncbi:acyltransferase family protein [Yersinia enterocolitica]|uniref:Acyltransferase family protein n=1 Tax=Yersinia enterocolitica TaxID=630 RepID=A0ABP1Y468_YEREN|nr:acyltransferase [Yersinia enterocolitica]CND89459.1 acyltransferase family protein [Yersinia enterocolitica]